MPKSTSAVIWLPGMSPDAPLYTPLTLQAYFSDTFLPSVRSRGLSSSRINELKLAVFRFNWWWNQERRTECPSLQDVTAGHLTDFRQHCIKTSIPGQDGRLRPCTARALNKSLQALEQIAAAAIEDRSIDESRGIAKVRKVRGPRQIGKLIIPDDSAAKLFEATSEATWPAKSADGKPVDATLLWRVALALFFNYGMRTQDLMRFDQQLRPIRWSCAVPAGQSPAEDGNCDSKFGWLYWIPNKTRNRKEFPMTLPLNATTLHWIERWREATRPKPTDPLIPIPACQKSLYRQWKTLLTVAGIKPKPKRTFDTDGNQAIIEREYKIKHLRCTAGTRAEEHGAATGHAGIGRWVTGHISNDVFERHYRAHERALMKVIETLPQPQGFDPNPKPSVPALRVVG